MKTLFIAIILVMFFTNSKSYSQNVTYLGILPTIDHSGKLNNKWSYYTYLFTAIKPYKSNIDGLTDNSRLLYTYAEFGMNYNLTSKLTVITSYVYQRVEPLKKDATNENRLFQQLTFKLPFNKFELKQRLRFDERFFANNVFKHRLRYLIGGKYTINDNYYLIGYIEFFFNTKNNFQYNENWSALQLGYNINKSNAIEAGLLYTGWIRNNNNDWLNQYYLQITWVNQLNLNKQKNGK
jgi:hypothetical protein